MTARDWAIDKLLNDRSTPLGRSVRTITLRADHGFTVRRLDLPDAHVYCPEGNTSLFTTDDVDRAVEQFSAVEFIVLLRRCAVNDVYAYAEQAGITVGRFSELRFALQGSPDISQFVSRERAYVLTRLNTNRAVQASHRIGENAYRITRTALHPTTLSIATFHQYEATADQIHSLLEQYADLDLDAIVATNPSTGGFSAPASEAARDADVKLITMNEFQGQLGRSWER